MFSMSAFADRQGRLWFAMPDQLIEVVEDQLITYGRADGIGEGFSSLAEDLDGRLFVGSSRGVFTFEASTDAAGRGRWKRVPVALRPDQWIYSITADSTGALWIGTSNGLIKYSDDDQTLYTTAHGLNDNEVLVARGDREGNLWIGTGTGELSRLPRLSGEHIVSFTTEEGLPDARVTKVIEDRLGRLYASTLGGGIAQIVGGRAVSLPATRVPPFHNVQLRILQDRRGDWWIGTDAGLFRFKGPDLQFQDGQKFTAIDGLPETTVTSLYEDPGGRVWVGAGGSLYWVDPATRKHLVLEKIPPETITPFADDVWMTGDRSGGLWLRAQGRLGRLAGGTLAVLRPSSGLPETDPRAFLQDSRGWLWVGLRYRGVSVSRDPTATPPAFVNYSTANGLASDAVWALAEDDFGRVYVGTGRGLDRIDPATGKIRQFTIADGLAGAPVSHCLKDSRGNIWIATAGGLSRLNPRPEPDLTEPPPIYLSAFRVAGEDYPLPQRGAVRIPAVELAASRNNLLIEYIGLSFRTEQALRYQYKLEGVDVDWSRPTEQRSINYARLAPGSYRFLVRAIDRDWVPSREPAALDFRILPPIWQRWWVVTLATVLIGLLGYVWYRYRLRRLLELERVRTRIATDLHDDIGSSLSQIAILSEVARRRADGRPDVAQPLAEIADASRELVDSMNDIVWSIDPERDRLGDLAHRMRRFAGDLLTSSDIRLSFDVPGEGSALPLPVHLRRDLYLIFKESLHNVVRHSGATEARVEFRRERDWLVLSVRDNGRGFDGGQAEAGHGLASMHARARNLRGGLEVTSNRQGTAVTLRVPLKGPAFSWRKHLHTWVGSQPQVRD
jgi:signal transduction histidine kinase/ligand-binding sensor domain-containing protein